MSDGFEPFTVQSNSWEVEFSSEWPRRKPAILPADYREVVYTTIDLNCGVPGREQLDPRHFGPILWSIGSDGRGTPGCGRGGGAVAGGRTLRREHDRSPDRKSGFSVRPGASRRRAGCTRPTCSAPLARCFQQQSFRAARALRSTRLDRQKPSARAIGKTVSRLGPGILPNMQLCQRGLEPRPAYVR